MDVCCASCGAIKIIDRTNNLGEIRQASGYEFLWDTADGLQALWYCPACTERLRTAFKLLKDVVGDRLRYISLSGAEGRFLP